MTWHARLQLDYRRDGDRTLAHDRHSGPLRVMQRLYPEGPGICHHVLVHPPAGIVGGDVLELEATLGSESHALITTPGATRFYRSSDASALQTTRARLGPGSRLEWLPQEALAYHGCVAQNQLVFELDGDAEMIGWDVLALGLPAAGQPFADGSFLQHLELPGSWLERGRIEARDRRLLDSPLGLGGRTVLAVMWFASGQPLPTARRDALLEAARDAMSNSPLAQDAGATAVADKVVVLRALAHQVEPAMALLRQAWAAWRHTAWKLPAPPIRLWRT